MRETIPLVGAPFSLHYASDRMEAYTAERTVQIRLSGGTVPVTLNAIKLHIEVAGQRIERAFPAAPNQSYTFVWNGLNGFGQRVIGSAPANIRVDFVYDGYYALPPSVAASFGATSGQRIPGDFAARDGAVLSRSWAVSLTGDRTANAQAGWSVTPHHAYSPASGEIFQGDGGRRAATNNLPKTIYTVAGNGISELSGDGGLARLAGLNYPGGLVAGMDGSLFIADSRNNRVRRVGRDGIITTIAGGGAPPDDASIGDGGPATEAVLSDPEGVALGADGSLYIAEYFGQRIRRVAPDGIITTVAGNGTIGLGGGDGGAATATALQYPIAVAVAADGTLFIAEYQGGRVRRVGPDGTISTTMITGGGSSRPTAVAVASDGSLFVAAGGIRRMTPDGVVRTFSAGALSFPTGIAIGPEGSVFIVDQNARLIRQVAPSGTVTTVAGNGDPGPSPDGGPATGAGISPIYGGVAIAPDGTLYISDYTNHRVRRVGLVFEGFSGGDIAIASEDGQEIYQFSALGRHLRTLNALTGAPRYVFSYDTAGLLSAVADGDGNQTVFERDALGNLSAIVAPYGQRTTVTLDSAGYLASVTGPGGDAYQASYNPGGLLTSFTNARGQVSRYTFNSVGRLLTATSADEFGQTLVRSEDSAGHRVSRTTALGRTTIYSAENVSAGSRRTTTFPDGTRAQVEQGSDGVVRTTMPDGTSTTILTGPDPRFGMQAPLRRSASMTMGSLVRNEVTTRTVALSAPGDPLSLVSLTDTRSINGRESRSVYDAANRTWTETSAAGRTATTATDNFGRPTLHAAPGFLDIAIAYDARGRRSTMIQGNRVTRFEYDDNGYLAALINPLNQRVSFANDSNGRVTRRTGADGAETLFGYDAIGNLTSVTPSGGEAHTFDYAASDLESAYRAPDLGGEHNVTTTTYDLDRSINLVTLPGGATIDPAYDGAGRLATLTIGRGRYTYAYYPTTGNLQSATAPDGGTTSYTYAGSLPLSETWSVTTSGSVSWTYDNDFRVASQSVNGASPIVFEYDADNLLIQAGAMTLTPDVQNGLLRATSLGTVADTYNYSAFGELSSYRAAAGGAELFNVTFLRDALGRITEKTEAVRGQVTSYVYTYDAAGQLDTVRRDGALVTDYNYDPKGNRTSAGTNLGAYDDQDRLLSYGAAQYTYAADGRLRTKVEGTESTTYTYDEVGNLISVFLPNGKRIEYTVDALNRRVGRRVDGAVTQRWLYDGRLRPIAELDAAGNVISRFVYGSRANAPDYMIRAGVTYRIVADYLGSPRLVVDVATGLVAQRMAYDEFGSVVEDSNPGFQPFGFAGGLWDPETRLVRFGARDYDPLAGRWTAKDPSSFRGGDTNLYRYVFNDPINFFDFLGKDAKDIKIPAAAGTSVVGNAAQGIIGILLGFLKYPLAFGVSETSEGVQSIVRQSQGQVPNRNEALYLCELDADFCVPPPPPKPCP